MGQSLAEFSMKWSHWQQECKHRLDNETYAGHPPLHTICKVWILVLQCLDIFLCTVKPPITTSSSPQWPLLSLLCPQHGRCGEVQLFLILKQNTCGCSELQMSVFDLYTTQTLEIIIT